MREHVTLSVTKGLRRCAAGFSPALAQFAKQIEVQVSLPAVVHTVPKRCLFGRMTKSFIF